MGLMLVVLLLVSCNKDPGAGAILKHIVGHYTATEICFQYAVYDTTYNVPLTITSADEILAVVGIDTMVYRGYNDNTDTYNFMDQYGGPNTTNYVLEVDPKFHYIIFYTQSGPSYSCNYYVTI